MPNPQKLSKIKMLPRVALEIVQAFKRYFCSFCTANEVETTGAVRFLLGRRIIKLCNKVYSICLPRWIPNYGATHQNTCKFVTMGLDILKTLVILTKNKVTKNEKFLLLII